MRNINDQYEQIQMTEDQAKKVKRELLRLTTGVASVVPLNCKGHECHPKGTNILVSDGKQFVVLEGHLRLTVFALNKDILPERLSLIIGFSEKMKDWSNF